MFLETINELLRDIPERIRSILIEEYQNLSRHYLLEDYRPAGLDAGRFCEAVYVIIEGYANGGNYGPIKKPKNMVDACRELESRFGGSSVGRSMRLAIPRLLPVIYDMRNNRDVGHVTEEINLNCVDTAFVMRGASWILAELVRVFGAVDINKAQEVVDGLARSFAIPLVWENDGRKIVMSKGMSTTDKVLTILQQSLGKRSVKELALDLSRRDGQSQFRSRIIEPGEEGLLWRLNEDDKVVVLSPIGAKRAEEIITRYQKSSE